MTSPSLWHSSRYAKKPGDGSEVSLLQVARFPAPFTTRHHTDAHFWPYVAYVDGKEAEHQISIRVEGRLAKGIDAARESVLCHYLVLEWDTPDHAPHDAELREAIVAELAKLPRFPSVLYWTRAGLRLVYRLSRPLHYEQYAAKIRGLALELQQATGLEVDPTCDQWWRCFRLPFVLREGEAVPTWEQPALSDLALDPVATLDPDEVPSHLGRLPWDAASSTTVLAGEGVPDAAVSIALAIPKGSFWRAARTALKKTGLFPYVFDAVALEPGTRDSASLRFAGMAVGKLFGQIEYLTPEHIYGLLLPLVRDLAPQAGESRESKLWRCVRHAWNQEAQKHAITDQKKVEAADSLADTCELVLAAHDEAALPDDPTARQEFALKHLVAVYGGSCYTASANGTYGHYPLRPTQLACHFRDQFPKLERIYTDQNNLRDGQSLIADFGFNVHRVRYLPGTHQGVKIHYDDGGPMLQIVPYTAREDLMRTAAQDREIEEYLEATGCRQQLEEYFCHVPALAEGGVAALSLKGKPGTGKTMLALAIAEVFGSNPVSAAEAFGRFNTGLLRTPVVLGDEGLPKKVDGMAVADLFRSMVTGADYPIEMKYGTTVMSSIPLRFVFTSNSMDLVRSLAGGRILTRDDTEALAVRLRHLEIDEKAAHWLILRGQMALTKWSARGPWIGGDPEKGGCRFARHIAWLYRKGRSSGHTVTVSHNQRLLVEGVLDPRMAAMLEGGGITIECVSILCQDIAELIAPRAREVISLALQIDGDGLWMRKQNYVGRLFQKLTEDGHHTSAADIRRVLSRWCTGQESQRFTSSPSNHAARGPTKATFHKMRLEEVVNLARQESIEHEGVLQALDNRIMEVPR